MKIERKGWTCLEFIKCYDYDDDDNEDEDD